VDDNSADGTAAVCAGLAHRYPLRVLVRSEPKDGLGGAVLLGLRQAGGKYLLVMDADLQHPPERIPDLLEPLREGSADFTLGSRYVAGGSTGEKWTMFRRVNSRVATALARPFAGPTRDPMSGFFALSRKQFESAQRLTPLGYKIGLELMCKCRVRQVREIPIHFATRQRGQSKMTLREQFRYLEHLSRLYDFTFPRLSPIAKFLIVMVLSWLVGATVMRGFLLCGVWSGQAVPMSYIAAILVEAAFYNRYIRTQREFLTTKKPWTDFGLISAAELATCTIVACWIALRVNHPRIVEMVFFSYGAATVARYVIRKELLQDVRGLRHEIRADDLS
ncbi:MAG: glycosyltransferase, partial [Phycisphaerae bacterium]|nr:glycosyltransferase [Phycisphaerae bacterium]